MAVPQRSVKIMSLKLLNPMVDGSDLRKGRSFVKTKGTGKKIFRGVVVFAILSLVYLIVWRVSMRASTSVIYLDDYRNYYFFTRFKPKTMPAPFGSSRQIIYFKPGQKGRMLKKIRKDVTGVLETLIEEHEDIFYKYEMSDDFSEVRIYETPDGIGRYGFDKIEPEVMGRIQSLIGLYHNIKKGDSASQPTDYIFDIIKPDG